MPKLLAKEQQETENAEAPEVQEELGEEYDYCRPSQLGGTRTTAIVVALERGLGEAGIFLEGHQEKIAEWSSFDLTRRNGYIRIDTAMQICRTISRTMAQAPQLACAYLEARAAIEQGLWAIPDETPQPEPQPGEDPPPPRPPLPDLDAVLKWFEESLLCKEVREAIEEHAEKGYALAIDRSSLDMRQKRAQKVQQFKDEHAKVLMKTCAAARLAAPVLTQMWKDCGCARMEMLIADVYLRAMQIFGPDLDLASKLYKFCESDICSTRYRHQVIWKYFVTQAKDPAIVSRNIYRKLVVDILVKIDDEGAKKDSNVISFLVSTIRNMLENMFQEDFPIAYKTVNMLRSNSDDSSEFEKMESNMAKLDEGQLVLTQVAVEEHMRELLAAIEGQEGWPEELRAIRNSTKINFFQKNIVFLYNAKHARSYRSLHHVKREEYMAMLLFTKKLLQASGYRWLPELLTANWESSTKKKLNRKEFLVQLTRSQIHKEVMEGKYLWASQHVVDSAILVAMMVTGIHSTWWLAKEYDPEEHGDRLQYEEEPVRIPLDEVAVEVLRFAREV